MSDPQIERETRRRALAKKVLFEWMGVIGFAFVVAILIRTFFLQQFYIAGPSMETTMFSDNRVLVDKISYRVSSIDRGDVVVFDRVTTSDGTVSHDDLIKRVIALPGDTVEIKNCVVIVNSKPTVEPYLDKEALGQVDPVNRCRVANMPVQTIPKKKIFVMGDNRPESFDSRSFGPISESLVVGRAFAVVWPFNRISTL